MFFRREAGWPLMSCKTAPKFGQRQCSLQLLLTCLAAALLSPSISLALAPLKTAAPTAAVGSLGEHCGGPIFSLPVNCTAGLTCQVRHAHQEGAAR